MREKKTNPKKERVKGGKLHAFLFASLLALFAVAKRTAVFLRRNRVDSKIVRQQWYGEEKRGFRGKISYDGNFFSSQSRALPRPTFPLTASGEANIQTRCARRGSDRRDGSFPSEKWRVKRGVVFFFFFF